MSTEPLKIGVASAADEIIGNTEGWWEHYHFQDDDEVRAALDEGRGSLDHLRLAEVERPDECTCVLRLVNGQRFKVAVTEIEPGAVRWFEPDPDTEAEI